MEFLFGVIKILKLVAMVRKDVQYTKTHLIVHFKRMNFMVYGLYLNFFQVFENFFE